MTAKQDDFFSVSHLNKTYHGQAAPCVKDLSFSLCRGQGLSLVGPSGHGKTTVLRIIAGHETPDSGKAVLGGSVLFDSTFSLPPQKRPISMVFQDLALFPHLSVKENILFGVPHLSSLIQEERLNELVDLMGISSLLKRLPREISGGQQQRVALARALITRPQLLLLDEPFSALDTEIRSAMREELVEYLQTLEITSIFVLHDQEDAFAMGDLVLLMDEGQKVECVSPDEMCLQPKSSRTADFLVHWSKVSSNLFDDNSVQNGKGLIYLRPEAFDWKGSRYQAVIKKVIPCGGFQKVILERNGHQVEILAPLTSHLQKGKTVHFDINFDHTLSFQ